MHKGWRPSEQSAVRYGLSLCTWRTAFFAGSWCIPIHLTYQKHVLTLDDGTGAAEWTTISSGLRGRYVFKWGWQDLRPHALMGQARGTQRIDADPPFAAAQSAAWAPHLAVGLASHIHMPRFGLHGGPYYRQETLYTMMNGEPERFKTTVIGIELGMGLVGE